MAFNPLRQLRDNIDAIRVAQAYRPGDKILPEAIPALRKYAGFGGLKAVVFQDGERSKWEKRNASRADLHLHPSMMDTRSQSNKFGSYPINLYLVGNPSIIAADTVRPGQNQYGKPRQEIWQSDAMEQIAAKLGENIRTGLKENFNAVAFRQTQDGLSDQPEFVSELNVLEKEIARKIREKQEEQQQPEGLGTTLTAASASQEQTSKSLEEAIVVSLAGEQAYSKATEKETVMAENTGYRRVKGVRI